MAWGRSLVLGVFAALTALSLVACGAESSAALGAAAALPMNSGAAAPAVAPAGPSPTRLLSSPSPASVPITTTTVKLTSGGVQRSYLLFAPTVSTPPASASSVSPLPLPLPLVVVLHGLGASPLSEAERTGFAALASTDQAVVAYPAGTDNEWDVGNGCCARLKAPVPTVNDVAFLNDVVSSVESKAPIDPTRLYLVGYSAGGKLASRIACAGGSPFAAVATYGAVPVTACSSTGQRLPVLIADGTADTALPYGGSAQRSPKIPSIASVVALWRTRDGCPASSVTTSPGPAVRITSWTCAGSTSVSQVDYPGHDHDWPNGTNEPAYANGETVIWAWLSAQP